MGASRPPFARQACSYAWPGSLEERSACSQCSAARTEGHGDAEPGPRGRLHHVRKTRALTFLLPLQNVLEEVDREAVVLGQVRACVDCEERIDLTLATELGRERVHVDCLELTYLILEGVHN